MGWATKPKWGMRKQPQPLTVLQPLRPNEPLDIHGMFYPRDPKQNKTLL